MVEINHTTPTRYVDLAAYTPREVLELIGELTVMFGRLEYMVLLAIKRKSGLSVARAQDLYKHHTLGAKVFGKQPCTGAGNMCRDFDSPLGLRSYSGDVEGLSDLCARIQELTTERNRIIHGLITTVSDEQYATHNNQTFKLNEQDLWRLKDRIVDAIVELNNLIPIPGLNASWVTGPDLDITYDQSALVGDDPIVSSLPSNKDTPGNT